MSKGLTEAEVRHVAKLARLKISDEEAELFGRQLSAILEYVAQLEELDTEGVEPLAHCQPIHNVFRKDEIRESLPNDAALANTPQRDGEYFAVPKVLGDVSS
jgi:aspartyl-tRNA(Asn)/glutamyl-tRNA(Gln) amidotransferase subunit C